MSNIELKQFAEYKRETDRRYKVDVAISITGAVVVLVLAVLCLCGIFG